jgi:hypothetical protein
VHDTAHEPISQGGWPSKHAAVCIAPCYRHRCSEAPSAIKPAHPEPKLRGFSKTCES